MSVGMRTVLSTAVSKQREKVKLCIGVAIDLFGEHLRSMHICMYVSIFYIPRKYVASTLYFYSYLFLKFINKKRIKKYIF